jgi:exopolysaccharide biosynthesis protein
MEEFIVKQEQMSIDELLADVSELLGDEPPAERPEAAPEVKKPKAEGKKSKAPKKEKKKSGFLGKFFRFFGRLFLFLLETALILVIGLYGLMFVLAKGPSPTARDLFVMSVRETSAMGWVANLYFSDEEIAQIENRQQVEDFVETDTSLIQIPKETEPVDGEENGENQGPKPDAWGLIDEDGDGIILDEVKGEGYSGYMMVVLDPSRVIVGSVPQAYGVRGYTVAEMVQHFDAVAGTNAGGFDDPNGTGNGSVPDTMVVFEGKVHYAGFGTRQGFVGFDSNHIMHVATRITQAEIQEKDIQYGVCFGPVLISNGEPCEINTSGVNPRTAIGQRSDGAILMLVIDGRQVISMGATMQDLIDIMLDYGAVNACNLDGGSSTLMWYGGDYVNNCASVIGIRPVPTAILVLKEGVKSNG